MELARAVGLSDEDLVQVRWGALLHDLGKLSVPDGVLLKPGPLTDEERVTMKKHSHFCLRDALSHSLPATRQGDQIPLVARIFAVVDVWDALNSDRPYRAAWPENQIREHIRSLSGTQFDPQVVDEFLQILR